MEHRVLLRNNIYLLLFIFFVGCKSNDSKNQVVVPDQLLNKAAINGKTENGLFMINNTLYSGTLFTLFPDTKDTAEITNFLNGKEHGEWRKYYPSKKIKEKRNFTNGQKTGELISWWENGNKQLHYNFEADEYEGTCKEWNIDGTVTKIMNYKKGHEEGPQQWWYDNGKIKANYIIKDGRRFGLLGTKNCINVSDSVFKN